MSHKKPYTHAAEYAIKYGEIELYNESRTLNIQCAKAIDQAITANNYELYHYDVKAAAKSVIDQHGFDRVNFVLATTVAQHKYDGRYSSSNRIWSQNFDTPGENYSGFVIKAHPTILDGLIDQVRKYHVEMLAEKVGGYEQSHHMAERNRLTWFHRDMGTFVPNPGVTEQRLMARFAEITEKKSVRDQIRAARKEHKQPSVPKPESDKKREPER